MPHSSFVKVDRYEAISPLMDGYFNEPTFTPEFTEEAFEAEYAAAYSRVFECLEAAEAAMSGLAEEAFSMGPEFSPDRKIGVATEHPEFLSADLLHRLWEIVKEFAEDYVITIDGAAPESRNVSIAILRREVLGYAENSGALAPLGFE